MSDLYLSYRSGSDRWWLPVHRKERTRCIESWQIWKNRLLQAEHIKSLLFLFCSLFFFFSFFFTFPSFFPLHFLPCTPSFWPRLPDNDLSVAKVMGYRQAALGENVWNLIWTCVLPRGSGIPLSYRWVKYWPVPEVTGQIFDRAFCLSISFS